MTSKTIYPSHYTEDDIATYDMLISQGKNLIGTKLRQDEFWVLELSAKMTINKHKGLDSELTPEEASKLRELHEKTRKQGVFETPKDYMRDGWIHPTDGSEPYENPLSKPQEYYNEQRLKPPKDVIEPPEVFENNIESV